LRYLGERIKAEGDDPTIFLNMCRDYGPDGVYLYSPSIELANIAVSMSGLS